MTLSSTNQLGRYSREAINKSQKLSPFEIMAENMEIYPFIACEHYACTDQQVPMYSLVYPIALRKAKIVCNFGLSGCNRVKILLLLLYFCFTSMVNI